MNDALAAEVAQPRDEMSEENTGSLLAQSSFALPPDHRSREVAARIEVENQAVEIFGSILCVTYIINIIIINIINIIIVVLSPVSSQQPSCPPPFFQVDFLSMVFFIL